MSIAIVLSDLMNKFGLNALDLERLTGVPSSTVYRILKKNGGNPTIEIIKKLSNFFQLTVSQLIGEEPIEGKKIPLIPHKELCTFISKSHESDSVHRSIPIDFPLNKNCFATICNDNSMEPYILKNSIVVIDPDRDINNKDIILMIRNENNPPIIRQCLFDGEDYYIKILNADFSKELIKFTINDFLFIGVIVHYRTNLFELSQEEQQLKMNEIIKTN